MSTHCDNLIQRLCIRTVDDLVIQLLAFNVRILIMNTLKWDKNFALEQAADDAELLQELLEIFKDSFQSDIQLIEQGLAAEEAVKVCRAAHSIKGAAASLGIKGVYEIALAIEEDSKTGGLENARNTLSLLKSMREELETL